MDLTTDVSIVLSGEAGQGLKTIEKILVSCAKFSGYNVFTVKEYMSRIRGGNNSISLRISSKKINAPINKIDLLVIFNNHAMERLQGRITPNTIIAGKKENIKDEYKSNNRIFEIDFEQIASYLGNSLYSNSVVVGFLTTLLNIDFSITEKITKNKFKGKKEKIVENNIKAALKGREKAGGFADEFTVKIEKNEKIKQDLLLNGSEAVGLGALAAGCNFVSSYPMSPSTAVLSFLAEQMEDFDLIVEQTEDEIAAINMSIGAWFAGARAFVTTSGGGFALMSEGLSLAGMLESPAVIHLAQRPGPATGLPTRSEQGDLELALYSGHGDFPRILLAPGTLEDAFYLTQKAFNLAAKFQVPVIILTDQAFVDQFYNINELELEKITNKQYLTKTDKNYKRYPLTSDGISPRGIPNYGNGLISADSDEHDKEGHITEDLDWRVKIVDKRLRKYKTISQEAIEPTLIGSKNCQTLIIGWGSTFNVIKEVHEKLKDKDVAILHFKQIHPLHSQTAEYLNYGNKRIIIENNATAQFGKLLKQQFGLKTDHKILKYNGLPFTVEELFDKVNEIL